MCLICKRIEMIKKGVNPYFVKELETGYVVIENYGNNGKGPVWWYPMEKMYSNDSRPGEEQLAKMKRKLLDELEKLL